MKALLDKYAAMIEIIPPKPKTESPSKSSPSSNSEVARTSMASGVPQKRERASDILRQANNSGTVKNVDLAKRMLAAWSRPKPKPNPIILLKRVANDCNPGESSLTLEKKRNSDNPQPMDLDAWREAKRQKFIELGLSKAYKRKSAPSSENSPSREKGQLVSRNGEGMLKVSAAAAARARRKKRTKYTHFADKFPHKSFPGNQNSSGIPTIPAFSQADLDCIADPELCDDDVDTSGWVRRSARMPQRSLLNAPKLLELLEKLRNDDQDIKVLKMKQFLPGMDAPTAALDIVLDALEVNTSVQSLYIQNYNEGMRDAQVLHLLKILKRGYIWCLNLGETYNVKAKTWRKFARGLRHTNLTHYYMSEHIIDTELKDKIRSIIRNNRSKHSRHIDPNNLEVIERCTHCWWNPINAKALRPYIKTAGKEYLLSAEAQNAPLLGVDRLTPKKGNEPEVIKFKTSQVGYVDDQDDFAETGSEGTLVDESFCSHRSRQNSIDEGDNSEYSLEL